MRGMREAKRITAAKLEARLPAVLETLAAQEGPEAVAALETPRFYATHEAPQLALDEWPAVVVVGQEAGDLRLVDRLDEGASYGDVYEATYRLRVFTFARAQSYAEVSAARDRLALAVRQVLLEELSVGDDDARVDPTSIRESYSDVMPDELGRSVAAAFLEVAITLTETVTLTALATVAGAEPTGHPAL